MTVPSSKNAGTQVQPFPEISRLQRLAPIDDSPGPNFVALLKKHKISPDEYTRIRSALSRAPTLAELGIFSAMWSEHCSYKSSRKHLGRFPTQGKHVVVGPGENAGVVRLSGKLCLAFKMESHNHPSYIEPYQGAATGVGGILRDVFCMGARPVCNLNALRFGELTHPKTQHLFEYAVRGIGDYGNCIGVPTVGGNLSLDASYNGNCLVNAMTVGTIHEDRIFKGYASGQGNLVVYVGSATGRDGIHGATMASDSFATSDASERSTVQVGDPFMEKLLLEATLEVLEKGLVVGLQDMGAAGLTSSAFEMAGRAGNGLLMDLGRVPVRTTKMTAYELLLSESQERMLMVVTPGNWPVLKQVLDRWQLESAVIGQVTGTGRVQIVFDGKVEADVPVLPITDDAPRYDRPIKPRARATVLEADLDRQVHEQAGQGRGLKALISAWRTLDSMHGAFEQYDQHIGTRTNKSGTHGGAAVLWMRSEWADSNEPWLGMATAASCNERYCRVDPRLGAQHAVAKAARMVAAVGGEPLAVTDCLNFGNPEDPEVMWEFSESVDGISDACRELGIAVVSGNVSLYNETDGVSIAPTPMIGMVGKVHDIRTSPPAILSDDSQLLLLAPKRLVCTWGGSFLAHTLGLPARAGEVPAIDWSAEREAIELLRTWIREGRVHASRDVGAGGVALSAMKMAHLNRLGLKLKLDTLAQQMGSIERAAFAEMGGAYLLACTEANAQILLTQTGMLKNCQLLAIGTAQRAEKIHTIGPWQTMGLA